MGTKVKLIPFTFNHKQFFNNMSSMVSVSKSPGCILAFFFLNLKLNCKRFKKLIKVSYSCMGNCHLADTNNGRILQSCII